MTGSLPGSVQDAAEVTLPDVAQASEADVAAEIQAALRRRWLDENQGAFQAWNDYVAEHGLPLAAYRQF